LRRNWILTSSYYIDGGRNFQVSKPVVSPGNGKVILSAAEQEVANLKKELRETQMERDILKKAISIFSKGDNKYSGS